MAIPANLHPLAADFAALDQQVQDLRGNITTLTTEKDAAYGEAIQLRSNGADSSLKDALYVTKQSAIRLAKKSLATAIADRRAAFAALRAEWTPAQKDKFRP